MQRATPPFRADHVGSLLRSAALKAAREQRARGEISAEAFKEIEDREGMGGIARQQAAGPAPPTPPANAACRHRHSDEVNLAYVCDPPLRGASADRGEDPTRLPAVYAPMINAAIADIPADMTITMHLGRGNFRSNFVATGGYEPIAELLFNTIDGHGYFMEND